MNKMKQLAFVIIGFIVAAIVIALLLGYTKNDIQRQVDNNNEKSLVKLLTFRRMPNPHPLLLFKNTKILKLRDFLLTHDTICLYTCITS